MQQSRRSFKGNRFAKEEEEEGEKEDRASLGLQRRTNRGSLLIIHSAKYFSELTEIHAYRRGLPVSRT